MDDFDAFIKEVEAQPSETVGEVLVFVDHNFRHADLNWVSAN